MQGSVFPTSTTYSTSDLDHSEKMRAIKDNAKAILAEKDEEIARLNREIDAAEKQYRTGVQAGMDTNAEMMAEIARLENELETLDRRADLEIHMLKEKQNAEIKDLKAKHDKEMESLYHELTRTIDDQDNLRRQQDRAARLKASFLDEADDHSLNARELGISRQSSTELHLQSARERARETEKEVERLEAELRRVTKQQQKQIAEQARMVKENEERQRTERLERQKRKNEYAMRQKQNEYDQQVKDLKAELKKESDEMKAKLRKLMERNDDLDNQLAAALAENDEKEKQLSTVMRKKKRTASGPATIAGKRRLVSSQKSARGKQDSMFAEFSVIEAEIIRLRDENEELRGILKKLDKLAYVS